MPYPAPEHSKRIYTGEILNVHTWDQTLFDGSTHLFECVVRQDSANIIPFLDKDTVLLTKQEQPGRPTFIDVPGGRIETGEDPQNAALRELREESGYHAQAHLLWSHKLHTGMIRFEEYLFLGGALTPVDQHLDPGERIETITVSWKELVQLCLENKLRQPHVMLAILCMEFNQPDRKRLQNFLERLP
ncbi:NUDIX hydrolase [Candidatus Uhrbacteria bacterium]|nr:NUDIX hydrolase [Candidatus Uhrbacteria bacterium]